MGKFNLNYDKWKSEYFDKEIVNLKKFFNEEDMNLFKKLGIVIKDKIYTEYEFEVLDMDTIAYYKDDEMDEEDLKLCKELPEGVTREEYNRLVNKMCEVTLAYNF